MYYIERRKEKKKNYETRQFVVGLFPLKVFTYTNIYICIPIHKSDSIKGRQAKVVREQVRQP